LTISTVRYRKKRKRKKGGRGTTGTTSYYSLRITSVFGGFSQEKRKLQKGGEGEGGRFRFPHLSAPLKFYLVNNKEGKKGAEKKGGGKRIITSTSSVC